MKPAASNPLRKFAGYVAIGAAAFCVDYSVFFGVLLATGNPYVGNVLGICAGMAVSFSINRRYNFRRLDTPVVRAARFVIVATFGMVASTLVIMLFLEWSIDARIAKVIAMLMVFAVQFLVNSLWTFR